MTKFMTLDLVSNIRVWLDGEEVTNRCIYAEGADEPGFEQFGRVVCYARGSDGLFIPRVVTFADRSHECYLEVEVLVGFVVWQPEDVPNAVVGDAIVLGMTPEELVVHIHGKDLVVHKHGDDSPLLQLAKAVVDAQWRGGEGMECETACPFCGADPYYGDWRGLVVGAGEDRSLEKHAADCPVLLAAELVGGADGED